MTLGEDGSADLRDRAAAEHVAEQLARALIAPAPRLVKGLRERRDVAHGVARRLVGGDVLAEEQRVRRIADALLLVRLKLGGPVLAQGPHHASVRLCTL